MRILSRLLALPFAALLIAADEPPTPRSPAPAIWRLSDGDTQIYLFGTNHILPQGFVWRSAEIERVIAEADELVLETADDFYEGKPERMRALMTLATPRPVLDRVGPEHRRSLEMALKSLGVPISTFDRMQTWAIAFVLMGASYQQFYGDGGEGELTGVEVQLTESFRGAAKPISGVETTPQQIGFFRNLSEAGQREFLEQMVAGVASGEESVEEVAPDQLESVWVAGDVAGLGAQCDSDESFTPEIREALLRRRNANWTAWLIDRLDRPGTLLFAVGACHLAGNDSVQTMLAARGFEATRVE
ncbi:MAG: TraB/GumN family protein [Sphingomonadaceae bacterium]|nr:TraB/GumN family protein [Sphingomonadaceae bacterium]